MGIATKSVEVITKKIKSELSAVFVLNRN